MGSLSTHVLDTANGLPAEGVAVRLYRVDGDRSLVTSAATNADGRTAAPLMQEDTMQSGCYELEFDVGDYFSRQGNAPGEAPFLGTVLIRVSLRADEKYHVPLLVSPWSYSTYRGS